MLAKTAAAGSTSLLPEVLTFSTSLAEDLNLLREDVLGSLAHATMLGRQKLIPVEQAQALRTGLLAIWKDAAAGTLRLPDEEDVHMAIEAELSKRVGEASGFLHTARSRNDQVALVLRMHVRERSVAVQGALLELLTYLADRAEQEQHTLLPAYTHRQRAQPISAAYWLLSWAWAFARDLETFAGVFRQANVLPLGVGAISGTSLPIDRTLVQSLLGFERITQNGMDTVGDRDFALDFTYAGARFLIHASRLSEDVVDYTSAEFGFLKLDGEIACGSSMMPQKKNPDVFELIRGKSGPAIGDLTSLLVTMKGLPGGYNRDQQEDRRSILDSGKRVLGVAQMLRLAIPRLAFDSERCFAALANDATQATDLAEALVVAGHPFRSAYKAVGALVRYCQENKVPLAQVTLEQAKSVDARFDEQVLKAAKVEGSVARKTSPGSTGPSSIQQQLLALRQLVTSARAQLSQQPRLDTLYTTLSEVSL